MSRLVPIGRLSSPNPTANLVSVPREGSSRPALLTFGFLLRKPRKSLLLRRASFVYSQTFFFLNNENKDVIGCKK